MDTLQEQQIQKIKTHLLTVITAYNMQLLLDNKLLRHSDKAKAKRLVDDFEPRALVTFKAMNNLDEEMDITGEFDDAIESTMDLFSKLFADKNYADIINVCKSMKGLLKKKYNKIEIKAK